MTGVEESRPSISIVIAAFNAARTIGEQLAAIDRQRVTFAFEVLVCDNGSTDDTADVVAEWTDRIPNLRIIDASARRGPGAARNIGVAHAHGRLITFCDADDVVSDNWLAEMHAALQEATFVAARIEHRRLNARFPEYLRASEGMTFVMPPLTQYPMVGAGHMGVHKSAFDNVGGFDESLRTAEDHDLSWRLQLAGHPLVGAPDAVVHVRIRATLRGVFKQAYGYGTTHRQLNHKYARVYAVHAPASATSGTRDAQDGMPTLSRFATARARARRAPRKLALIARSPLELAPHARRLGLALGRRFGRVDEHLVQLEP